MRHATESSLMSQWAGSLIPWGWLRGLPYLPRFGELSAVQAEEQDRTADASNQARNGNAIQFSASPHLISSFLASFSSSSFRPLSAARMIIISQWVRAELL